MLFSDLRLSLPCVPMSCMPNTFLLPHCGYVVTLVKNKSLSSSFTGKLTGRYSCRALPTNISSREASHVSETCEPGFSGNSSEEKISCEEIQLDFNSNSSDCCSFEDHKESLRRRKIGLANKGKVPWNKGRKHNAETRERIRQRTKEAMSDPKVRKKMSECPRAHSNQTKARIRSSLRRVWGERLKWNRSREKFLISWARSIAKAAKRGGSDQQELDWDSYEKIKREIASQQLQWLTDRAKAKEMARIRGQRAAQEKADKLARIAQKRTERAEKAKIRSEIRRKTRKKSKEERDELAVAQELKLKEKLIKIHRKKSINGRITNQVHRAWERFDLELVKNDQMRKEVSLADQIRAVKDKRALTTTSYQVRNQ